MRGVDGGGGGEEGREGERRCQREEEGREIGRRDGGRTEVSTRASHCYSGFSDLCNSRVKKPKAIIESADCKNFDLK